MGKSALFIINFANASKIFYPGQPVNGEVQLELKEDVKVRAIRLEFGGFAHVRWTEQHGSGKHRRTVTYYSREDYFKQIVNCQSPPPGSDNMILKPGSYRYPFQFQLPPAMPSSFEGHFGRVRYYVKATMDKPWAFDEDITHYYTVVNLLDLNMQPDASKPGEAANSKTLCCLCCESGPITGKHRINKLGYVPGEAIQIEAECVNHSNRDVKMTRMELVQVIYYKTPSKTRPVSTIVQRLDRKLVGKGDTDFWSGQQLVIPPLPSSGLVGCNIIDIQYFWQYVCEPSGPAFSLRVPINIIIGGIPLVTAARQYGATNPMNYGFGGSSIPAPAVVFPDNVPRPAFASFSTYNNAGAQGQGNAVQPSDDTPMDTFSPHYPYYNWNQYDTTFKPQTY